MRQAASGSREVAGGLAEVLISEGFDHSLGIDRLSIEERLVLVEEIWDSIAADSAAVPLTDAQRAELQKRIEEDDAGPDDVTSWEQVKASSLATLVRGQDE